MKKTLIVLQNMKRIINLIRKCYLCIKYLPIIIIYTCIIDDDKKLLIKSDLYAWNLIVGLTNKHILSDLIKSLNERKFFRNLFYHRLNNKYLTRLLTLGYPEEKYFHINPETIIGSSLKLSHPFGSFLNAKSIGDHVEILHNVTIGFNGKDFNAPIIGNNVFIGSGAAILGGIRIGDNVKLEAIVS